MELVAQALALNLHIPSAFPLNPPTPGHQIYAVVTQTLNCARLSGVKMLGRLTKSAAPTMAPLLFARSQLVAEPCNAQWLIQLTSCSVLVRLAVRPTNGDTCASATQTVWAAEAAIAHSASTSCLRDMMPQMCCK